MAPQPTGDATLTDADLDEAVQSMFDEETEAPTGAPAVADAEPVPDGTSSEAVPDNAPAGDETPDAAVAAQPVAEVPPTASAPAAPASGKPFQFKASGRDHSLPWASELPDGSVVIPKDAQAEFRRELASGRELQQNFRTFQRETNQKLRDAQTQRTQKDAEADAVIGLMSELVRMTPEQQFQYLSEFQGNVPQLQLDLRKRQLDEQEKRLADQAKGPQMSAEEQQEREAELVSGEFDAEWSKIAAHPDLKFLTATEQQQIRERWQRKPDRLVRTIRTPEEAKQYNGAVGDRLFDPTEFYEDLNFVIGVKRAAQPPAPSKAAEQNAIRNADKVPAVNRIPPTARSAPPVAQQPRDKTGKFTDRKNFAKDFMKDDDDE
jgi:hypothetical protein